MNNARVYRCCLTMKKDDGKTLRARLDGETEQKKKHAMKTHTVSLMDVFFFFFPDDDDGDSLLLLFFPSSSALKPSFKVYPPPFLSFVVFFPSYRSSSSS